MPEPLPFLVIIPARYDSKRLPGKLAQVLAGRSVLQHSYEAARASGATRVLIAAADERIRRLAEAFGAPVCMTDPGHRSGTERLGEVVDLLGLKDRDLVVNVQGDEPLLPPCLPRQVASLLQDVPEAAAASLYAPLEDDRQAGDPSVVKVVVDARGCALYFSRAPIPAYQPADQGDAQVAAPGAVPRLRHIGLYAYRAGALRRYRESAVAPLERSEGLEQLRLLFHGERIQMALAEEIPERGVDTPEDLRRLRERLEGAAAAAGVLPR